MAIWRTVSKSFVPDLRQWGCLSWGAFIALLQIDGYCPLDTLFCEMVLVPPVKFRPIRLFKGERFENPQTVNLRKLLEANETVKACALLAKGHKDAALLDLVTARTQGKTLNARMHSAYLTLQLQMSAIFDEDLNKVSFKETYFRRFRLILNIFRELSKFSRRSKASFGWIWWVNVWTTHVDRYHWHRFYRDHV